MNRSRSILRRRRNFPLVQGDSGMIEQVVMNLCVNARDAMERGGTLTISLSTIDIAEDYVHTHPEARVPAHTFVLRVTDTGCGMDTYMIGRIFEPFFTTKEVGKGTGLGLATVYGIVKQHEGWVEVNSKLGLGTHFEVFLPATVEIAQPAREEPASNTPVTGGRKRCSSSKTNRCCARWRKSSWKNVATGC